MRRNCLSRFSPAVLMTLATITLWGAGARQTAGHCQVPCGIYDDAARIKQLKEDHTTITKAITQINELAGSHEAQAFNQAARWVATKEEHASHVIEVVADYFLAQRVKPAARGGEGYDAYLARLADHHAVIVAAMKAKQSADPAAADALLAAINTMAKYYH
ncbi:MAG: superoxide dismutase [Ni] [Phycisphaerae bacterium]